MKVFNICTILALLSTSAIAQSGAITFPSSELQNVSLRYTGDTLNWPIIVALADRDVQRNTFTLLEDDILRLEILGSTTATVLIQKNRMKELIENGATIFAREELINAVQAVENFDQAVKEGNIESAIAYGVSIEEQLDSVENTLEENRMVEVQAQLEKKTGMVDKRIGLLGGWNNANEGDLFKESDGVRTQEESYANLGFTDGT
ncbi:MAG: hypothetical protein MI700_03285, partial [Balneolales bacterium]|nr:hypothetical protein [Balneolales bacterium]